MIKIYSLGSHSVLCGDGQPSGLHSLLDLYLQQESVRSVQPGMAETDGLSGSSAGGEGETEAEGCHDETAVGVSQCARYCGSLVYNQSPHSHSPRSPVRGRQVWQVEELLGVQAGEEGQEGVRSQ